ncbi:MAG TPA: hypothetical protein VLF89_08870 [Candidatus Saccharimonadales bacterium]|nr:hypothetical protein [Candidatus Saccharimonadales bacterium]
MTTYLIISKNSHRRENHASELAAQQHIHKQDLTILETEGSIGIEAVRDFQKQIMLKPMRGENKAVIIKDAHTLTIEAQNALLKTLEEPPPHTYIYLLAENTNNFLQTILSRTSLISLSEENQLEDKTLQEVEQQINIIFSDSIGDKLKLAENLSADKPTAIAWIEKTIYILRNLMIEKLTMAKDFLPLLESLQKTHIILKTTNVNVRLALENLFLSI